MKAKSKQLGPDILLCEAGRYRICPSALKSQDPGLCGLLLQQCFELVCAQRGHKAKVKFRPEGKAWQRVGSGGTHHAMGRPAVPTRHEISPWHTCATVCAIASNRFCSLQTDRRQHPAEAAACHRKRRQWRTMVCQTSSGLLDSSLVCRNCLRGVCSVSLGSADTSELSYTVVQQSRGRQRVN